jgi:glucokinase
MVNHEWLVDAAALAAEFGWRKIWLLNDLKAAAHAVPGLPVDELAVLNEGQPETGGNIAVIAPGTGLGQGYLTWDGARYVAHATEGGHSDFAPNGALQRELLAYLAADRVQVCVEDVCSGIGVPNIYNFLRDSSHAEEPEWLAEQLADAEDPTPIIFESALSVDHAAQISKKALELFVKILGSEAGNLALKIGATGGLYVGGGIPPRILSNLKEGAFLKAFLSKEKYADYMSRIPVKVILNPDSALLGAAQYALDQFERL